MNTKLKSILAFAMLLGVSSPGHAADEKESPAPAGGDATGAAVEKNLEEQVGKILSQLNLKTIEEMGKDGVAGAPEVQVTRKKYVIGPDGKLREIDGTAQVPRIEEMIGEALSGSGDATGVRTSSKILGKVTVIGPDGTKQEVNLDNLSGLNGAIAELFEEEKGMAKVFAVGPGILLNPEEGKAASPVASPSAIAPEIKALGDKVDKLQKDMDEMREILKAIQSKLQ